MRPTVGRSRCRPGQRHTNDRPCRDHEASWPGDMLVGGLGDAALVRLEFRGRADLVPETPGLACPANLPHDLAASEASEVVGGACIGTVPVASCKCRGTG